MVADISLERTDVSQVRRGAAMLARRLRAERPDHGISALKISVLAHLRHRGPVSPGELATLERLQPQSLSRALASLEVDGLVSRRPDDEDRRRSLLELTEAGLAVLRADLGRRETWLAAAMEQELTPAERAILAVAGELMQRLAESP